MRYGKIVRQTEINIINGDEIPLAAIYHQSIFLSDDDQPIVIFEQLMTDMRAKKLSNPGIQVELYPDTGKIKRVVKSWTEVK